MNQRTILKQLLSFGITDCIGERPINRFKTKEIKSVQTQPKIPTETEKESVNFVVQAEYASQKATNLTELNEALQKFEGCSLKKTAHYMLSGIGQTENPTVMCIIDAPKSADEKVGKLNSGESGILLLKMLKAIHLDIETNTYLCPLIPWRLPGDRIPTETEIQVCLPFLKRRIELIVPSFLLVFGNVSTRALFGIDSIAKARQQMLMYQGHNLSIQSVATFGPDMVSKAQTYRKSAWEDLQKLASYIQN